jgi:DNA-binding beta-propeller fold protein YncE
MAHVAAVSPGGDRVYITGCGGGSNCTTGYATVAYDTSSGQKIWAADFLVESTFGSASSMGISPDGSRVFVTGTVGPHGKDAGDFGTVAYEAATGRQLWSARFDQCDGDYAYALKVSPDGTQVFVEGLSSDDGHRGDYTTISYDAATGTQLWLASYNGPGNPTDWPHALAVSPDGSRVFVTGETEVSTQNDFATVAYDAVTGARLWAVTFNDPAFPADTAYAVAVSPDGDRVFVSGCAGTGDYCIDSDFATIAYDAATGSQLWVSYFDGPAHTQDIGRSVAVSPDGEVLYVGGPTGNTPHFATVAYSAATGAELWSAVYYGANGGGDYPVGLAISPKGSKVFVTGNSFDDISTVAYDAETGVQDWASRFGRPDKLDAADAIAVSPDGESVFVTGTGTAEFDYRYLTIAYAA